jgi:hypothetical protein
VNLVRREDAESACPFVYCLDVLDGEVQRFGPGVGDSPPWETSMRATIVPPQSK